MRGTRRGARGARGARRVWCDRARREAQERTARDGRRRGARGTRFFLGKYETRGAETHGARREAQGTQREVGPSRLDGRTLPYRKTTR
jgi:hypothetical protein